MSSVSSHFLSGSSGGQQVLVAATSTPGTTVHSTGTSSTIQDEVWIWCTNSDTTARKLTIEWGGVTAPNDLVEITIPPESGPVLVIPGWRLSGTGSVARVVRAFAATANVLVLSGYVHRYTP